MRLRFKRHYPLLVLLVLVGAFLTLGIGSQRIIAYTAQGGSQEARQGIDHAGTVALFDDTVVHSIQILIPDEDYQQMITTFQETGEKDYFHADVIIDGVRVNDVGLRLKGNASLMTALGGRGGMRMAGRGERPEGAEGLPPFDPENMPADGQRPELPGLQPGQMPDFENMPFGPPGDQMPGQMQGFQPFAQTGEAKVPLMIKFDEFVSGQTYQGYTNLAVRTYGAAPDAAMLQEPITNAIFRLVGLPATQTAYVGMKLNDDAEQLYTLSEVINEVYLAKHFANPDGVLYKAEIGSTLRYQGEDPSAYANSFTQQTRVNDADLAPLIDFMRFLSESDDATFERELTGYLDVESFATYLAVNNLLVNTDSMVGMNNNYYLYYDDAAQRFTVLMWDGNEGLGKLAGGANAASHDLYATASRGDRGFGGGANALVERFMANATFKALYEQKLQLAYEKAFLSGEITRQVEQYAALIRETNTQRSLVDLDSYNAAVTSVLSFITQRENYLATTPLLGG